MGLNDETQIPAALKVEGEHMQDVRYHILKALAAKFELCSTPAPTAPAREQAAPSPKPAPMNDFDLLFAQGTSDAARDTAQHPNFEEFWSYVLTEPRAGTPPMTCPPAENALNPLTWWRDYQRSWPTLALAARTSFAVPSTSVMPESLFSRVKHLERDQQKGAQLSELLGARVVCREADAAGKGVSAFELNTYGKNLRP